jgi:hypothetical protein
MRAMRTSLASDGRVIRRWRGGRIRGLCGAVRSVRERKLLSGTRILRGGGVVAVRRFVSVEYYLAS